MTILDKSIYSQPARSLDLEKSQLTAFDFPRDDIAAHKVSQQRHCACIPYPSRYIASIATTKGHCCSNCPCTYQRAVAAIWGGGGGVTRGPEPEARSTAPVKRIKRKQRWLNGPGLYENGYHSYIVPPSYISKVWNAAGFIRPS
ncbi:uncharacterized protein H6S33_010349 [Morchella sextelata]|uniref:uncharacterized protein n=1 Tax=Morchella sextelata TaxID=1174677 RepID=UPI001D04AABD|nr:uncharacterized protein H6S33_010349 [Morchella sextelata]KAH0612297.1 hypothetical protein H6S33_010349 [Morchella sextelata]